MTRRAGIGMKSKGYARDWGLARAKLSLEDFTCRNCGEQGSHVECAHILGREHDSKPPIGWMEDRFWDRPWIVVPERIIPLCGPATDTGTCHNLQHSHRLDLLKLLTVEEQLQAVADAGGIEPARKALEPGAYPERRVA